MLKYNSQWQLLPSAPQSLPQFVSVGMSYVYEGVTKYFIVGDADSKVELLSEDGFRGLYEEKVG